MAELISKHLDQDLFRLVNGAVPETTKVRSVLWTVQLTETDAALYQLLELPWDHSEPIGVLLFSYLELTTMCVQFCIRVAAGLGRS